MDTRKENQTEIIKEEGRIIKHNGSILIILSFRRFRPRNTPPTNVRDEIRIVLPNQDYPCECCLGILIKQAGLKNIVFSCLQRIKTKLDFVYKHPTKQVHIPADNRTDGTSYGPRYQGNLQGWYK